MRRWLALTPWRALTSWRALAPWLALTLLLAAGPAGAQVLQEVVTDVWVHDAPGPPQGDFWDSAAAHLLSTFTNPASVYPDVMICARPARVAAPHCTKICWDLKGDSHGDGKHPSTECQQSLHVPLVPNDPRMVLEVLEMDRDGDRARVHAIIARNVVVSDPSHCTADQPCRWSSSKGALVLSFSTQMRGVLGTPPPPSPSAAPPDGGAAPAGPSLRQPAQDGARKATDQYAESKDPTAFSRETVQRASAQTQASINSCLSGIAHSDATLRSRMPLCANLSGKPFEDCMYSKVLYDDNTALTQGYACSRQYQQEADTLAKAGAYVWLKGQVCGIGQWIGLEVCRP
ncbi:MAG TPA: hypothetical protein VFX20_15435 [Steroidobacteraceae bacterium]|nr:hypothetical protein [Steroidobacteraceae bacterium]